nr:FAD-binding protein [Arthrobacter sp. 35W]
MTFGVAQERTRPNTQWRNWAGDQRCTPAATAAVSSVEQIADIVRAAAQVGGTVRAVGAGHSFTDIALTSGTQLSMDALSGLLKVDRTLGHATFAAGTRLHEVPALLAPYGLALANMGDIDRQSIAGAISTGTHGTGLAFGGMASQVVELVLVTGLGEVRRCSPTSNPELFWAARIGLGALGIIVSVALACVPSFDLHAVERREPLAAVLESLPERLRSTDHFEFYWFPHTELALTKANTRIAAGSARGGRRGSPGPGAVPPPLGPLRHLVDDVLLSNTVFGALCAATGRLPRTIPAVNRAAAQWTGSREFADASTGSSPRNGRCGSGRWNTPCRWSCCPRCCASWTG